MKKEKMSRRDFLKGAGAVVGGAAVSTSLMGMAAYNTSAASGAAPITWDRETDILVIGSGFAGLAAAVEAKRGGADVLVIEKNSVLGGNSIQCAGNIQLGGGTSTQIAAGIRDTWQRFYNDIFTYGSYRADPDLLRVVCQESVKTHDWLKELGLNFRPTVTADEGHTVPCSHNAANGAYPGNKGISQWYVIYKRVKEQGTPMLLNCKAVKLLTNAEGACIGAQVQYEGRTQNFKARKAVFLGAGGWKSNVAMRLNWDPRLNEDLAAGGAPFCETSGEMINAAVDIGAGMRDMSFVCEFRFKWGTKIYSSWYPTNIESVPGGSGLNINNFDNIILLKNGGVRFVDENAASAYPQIPFYNAFLNIGDKPRNVWAITDTAGAASLRWNTNSIRNANELQDPFLSPSCAVTANTLEELAVKMGFPAAAVAAEVAKYNRYVDEGKDPDFNKQNMKFKCVQGPFYAVKCQFFAHDQMGGLAVNTRGQIIKRSASYGPTPIPLDRQEVIPHLYGAGETVGGYVGEERGHGKIGLYISHARISAPHMVAESPIA